MGLGGPDLRTVTLAVTLAVALAVAFAVTIAVTPPLDKFDCIEGLLLVDTPLLLPVRPALEVVRPTGS
jgi:hypothetical protein